MNVRLLGGIGLLAGAFCLSGCAAFVAGSAVGVGGAVAYVNGELRQVADADPKAVQEAITAAAERLELAVIEAYADGLSGEYLMRTGKDEKIRIRYEKRDDQRTNLFIRVGLVGDRETSQVVLDEILQGL